ncbi:hypothetical protein [Microlunatus sp. GCM10028923]|uniref:hypothetical protein n=1 Tax=Microlunatus sp. GCM10028923 TaxID=3273400 RepID=UPI0036172BC7
MGAGAAIRDAARMCEELTSVRQGDKPLTIAVRDFNEDCRQRGAAVVAASLPTIRQILATGTATGSVITRAALPALAAVHRLRLRPAS